MVRLRANVAEAENCVWCEFPFNREKIVFVVGIRIRYSGRGHSGLRQKGTEVDARVRVMNGRIERRKRERKRIHMNASVDRINERSCGKDFTRTRIRQTRRRLGFINTDRVSLNHG